MYNKKCISTFLFCVALASLITLILPFVNVNFYGDVSLILKIIYYICIAIFGICIVAIIAIGIFNLFKSTFTLVPVQEFLSFCALSMLLILVLIFLPVNGANLTVGFSILLLETFVLSCFNPILKLIEKLPRTIRCIKESLRLKKEQKQKILQEKEELEKNSLEKETLIENTLKETEINEDEVKIIPPNDNDDLI